MKADLDTLPQTLGEHSNFCVAYSGGIDSHVLLHALVQLQKQQPRYQVRAIHVNHGIHPNATTWQQHCHKVCDNLNIPCESYHVAIQKTAGKSLEALAREARYHCLSQHLQKNECLLTAHHADDQVETFLLQLLRGSGINGLAAMPIKKTFQQSVLLRPLLHSSRDAIKQYARQHQLQWVEDESNQALYFDRNYLRHDIIPRLKQRWPQLLTTINRSAIHCATAMTTLQQLAADDLAAIEDHNGNIDIHKLCTYAVTHQQHILRHWIRKHEFPLPDTKQLNEIFKTVIHSRYDAAPCFQWGNQEIRRYRHHLYLLHQSSKINYQNIEATWHGEKYMEIPEIGNIAINFPNGQQINRKMLKLSGTIRFRRGGERIKLSGEKKTKTLKHLFQHWGVPPWIRSKIPLLYHKEQLIAVVGHGIAEGWQLQEKY